MATRDATIGQDHKLYYDSAGSWSLPTWVELTRVINVEPGDEREDIEIAYRGADIKRHVAGQRDMPLEFAIAFKKGDTSIDALIAAYKAKTIVHLADADGAIATSGTLYTHFELELLSMAKPENLNEGDELTFTAAIADTSNDPVEVTAP